MRTTPSRAVLLGRASIVFVLLGLGIAHSQGRPPRRAAPRPSPSPTPAARPAEATWEEADRLVKEQKYEAAAAVMVQIRARAQARGDEADWTRALVREAQVRSALHGYETVVRFLRETPWPPGPEAKAILDLFYGQTLVHYLQAYSWEIRQRERVESKDPLDLKKWTTDEIGAEATRAYSRVWAQREKIGPDPVDRIGDYLQRGNYPPRIRGTVRDAVSYLIVELLADTALWSPEQHELYRLDVAALLAPNQASLEDPAVHPLTKLAAVLTDLEAWHTAAGRREAAFEARLERLRRLHASFTASEDRTPIRRDLENRLPAMRDLEWWAVGQATLADFVKEEEAGDALVGARAIALAGAAAYPESIGGRQCRAIAAAIETPAYQLTAMSLDGPARRSIEVAHANLSRLYFRAYAVDLEARMRSARDYNLLPGWQEVPKLIDSARPAAEWTSDLPATPDYRRHQTFVTPPLSRPGLYVVVASSRTDFRRQNGTNHAQAVNLLISDLVLVQRSTGNAIEVVVTSGRTGEPVPSASVELWQLDWQKGHHPLATRTAAGDGVVTFDLTGPGAVVPVQDWRSHQLALIARRGGDTSLSAQVPWSIVSAPPTTHASLVYTDRSVYRPQQKLLWKVVAYEGGGEESRFRTSPRASVSVELVDANGQVVATQPATTNDYGSAAGEFTIPAGRLLGQWSVRSSLPGQAVVRVEEYKRPTFEVTLLDPEQEIRLNRPATLRGDVKYYFGLPVTTGKVAWRVTRQAVQPWWWWYWGGSFDAATRVVAAGDASLGADGRFSLSFTPEADARASRELTWTYAVEADVTDEGGETRSATRRFRLGFVSVEARLTDPPGFVLENRATSLPLLRTDLDGTPRAGSGAWRLVSLQQPPKTLLPAEQPLPAGRPEARSGPRTPGDELRLRSDPQYTPAQVLRLWTDGSAVASGTVAHDARGEAVLALPALRAGAYRLHYETRDAAGATFQMTQELVVAQERDTPLALPGLLAVERASVPVGGTARVLVHSGVSGQPMTVEIWRGGRRTDVRHLVSGRSADLIELPISAKDRGGFGVTLTLVRDHQLVHQDASVFVPWDDRALAVAFSTFRDKLRPADRETWRITVSGKDRPQEATLAAEVLASMYDRSLDLFAPHVPADALSIYPSRTGGGAAYANLGRGTVVWSEGSFAPDVVRESLDPDRLAFWSGYAIGGPGRRRMYLDGVVGGIAGGRAAAAPMAMEAATVNVVTAGVADRAMAKQSRETDLSLSRNVAAPLPPTQAPAVPLRTNFSETAFWQPQLLTGPDGSATFEFTVPDSVTSWNVWASAITRDLRAGSVRTQTRSVKELMVRPYLPRFLREGDRAEIKIVINNASDGPLSGEVAFELEDPDTHESLLAEFGVDRTRALTFAAPASGSANVTVPIIAPKRLGAVAVKVVARAGDRSDGEQRALPVLPSRLHLVESRFVTVKGATSRTLTFSALARSDDPSRQTEQLVVTLDAQLFYGVLQALPYLVNYPYECTEQTLNRFVSTGILSSLFGRYPAIAKMAAEMAKRDTRLEQWDRDDPNRRMQLEETPWVVAAKGGAEKPEDLAKVLDPRIAKATREEALAKLAKAQTSLGAFPWWPGGPPSPYMTLYTVHGMSKAREFGVDVPKDMVKKAFAYLHRHYLDEWVRDSMKCDCGWEFVTFLGYVLTSYPDDSWTGGVFTAAERAQMLDFSFRHWKQHSPYLKGYLALTLQRRGRPADARLVWDSVMDSAKTDADTGTSWAPEDRAWLWYNDTIETHAFALRTLAELAPRDPRREGLVQWLFLHKKLNHWSSTRSTAEVLYALAHYLQQENQLGVREDATVKVGTETRSFVFEPGAYTGKATQVVIPGARVDAERSSAVVVEKTTPGMMFASATWHYATDRLPSDEAGDLFAVSRRYFRRENRAGTWTLVPIAEGAALATGDEVEVQLSLRAKQAAEYVHLRDPRGAGFEPVTLVSGFKWQTGLGLYEEVRDSGENFFFEWLPAGEYTFRYRIRAATAGRFRVGPAEVQSMYAPEFTARSAGAVLEVGGGR